MATKLFLVDASWFSAGAISVDGKVTDTAPIIKSARGWTDKQLIAYCKKKGWQISSIRMETLAIPTDVSTAISDAKNNND